MITACLIILAWAIPLPAWASITVTVLASLRCLGSIAVFLGNFIGEHKK